MKSICFKIFYLLGMTSLALWWNRRRVVFLCYHGVTERATRSPLDPEGFQVRADRFADQLDHLKNNYQVISLSEFLDADVSKNPLSRPLAVITFDDGYRNFLTAAWPQLRERGLPVTLFLITGQMVATNESASTEGWREADDATFLSWDEARLLSSSGTVTFGSHTWSHPRLTDLTESECNTELARSKDALATELDQSGPPLAYPWGDSASWVAELARELGYSCAVTTSGAANDSASDRFALSRVLIGDDDDIAAFAVRVSGLRYWLDRARNGLLRKEARSQAGPIPPSLSAVSKFR